MRIMLLGSYGQTNLGDDLLLRNYLKYFRELGHEDLLVSATNVERIPQTLRDAYPSARYFEPYRAWPLALVRLLLSADVIVYGGGPVYKELYASTGREKYSVITRVALFNLLARALRRPVYNLNISIGHLSSRRGRLITKLALWCCRTTLMRDERSHELRFHSLVLAATTGTPFVGISYDIKCATFLTKSAYDHWIPLEDVNADRLLDALDRLGAGPSDGTRPLEAAVSPLFARARADLAAALSETALR